MKRVFRNSNGDINHKIKMRRPENKNPLRERIKQYLAQNNKRNIAVNTMADVLHLKYPEYRTTKKSAFKQKVQNTYILLCTDIEREKAHNERERNKEKEEKDESSEDDLSSDGSDDEGNVLGDSEGAKGDGMFNSSTGRLKNPNAMNDLLSNMYSKSNASTPYGSIPGTPNKGYTSGTNTPGDRTPSGQSTPFNNNSSKDLFMIDKTGSRSAFSSMPGSQASSMPASPNPAPTIDLTEVATALTENQPVMDLTGKDTNRSARSSADRNTSKSDGNKKGDKSKKRSSRKVALPKKQKSVTEPVKATARFTDVGGVDNTLIEICKLLVHMKHPEVYEQLGVTPPKGFLLHGPPGCGKTLLAHAIAGELDLPFLKLSATEIVSGVSGESEEKLRDLFAQAKDNAPCVLFLDEIDAITQKRETASKEMERRIVSQLLTCMDEINTGDGSHVMVIGATNRPDSLDPALRRAGRFDREIAMGIPDEKARCRILTVLSKNLRLAPEISLRNVARDTPGFVGADLSSLVREAASNAVHRVFKELQEEHGYSCTTQTGAALEGMEVDGIGNTTEGQSRLEAIKEVEEKPITSSDITGDKPKADEVNDQKDEALEQLLLWLRDDQPLSPGDLASLYITETDIAEALKTVQPSAKREGFATIPDVTWDDIGALSDIRDELQMAILAPVRHPDMFKQLGLTTPPGVLLAGPPGCGKTLLAKAIANESGINFISVKGPELLNMYVGESERAVRQVFQRGRNSAPCVIFFDELDSLCPMRSGHSDSGSSVRVVNQLLTEMDGLEERKQVFVMAATNRPDIIDPAILRPGRLDKILYVGLPTADDRADILKTITKNGEKTKLDTDVNLAELAASEKCHGYSGADLLALVHQAGVAALRQAMKDIEEKNINPDIKVAKRHFDEAFRKVVPSVSEEDQKRYKKMRADWNRI